jgi:hypothetical protein
MKRSTIFAVVIILAITLTIVFPIYFVWNMTHVSTGKRNHDISEMEMLIPAAREFVEEHYDVLDVISGLPTKIHEYNGTVDVTEQIQSIYFDAFYGFDKPQVLLESGIYIYSIPQFIISVESVVTRILGTEARSLHISTKGVTISYGGADTGWGEMSIITPFQAIFQENGSDYRRVISINDDWGFELIWIKKG